MKDRAAYQAAGASQQTVESSGTPHLPGVRGHREGAREEDVAAGADVPALFHRSRSRSVRRGRMGAPRGRHRQRGRQCRVRAARRRDPEGVVAAGHQHRRLEVFPRPDRHARARAQRAAAHRPRREHDHRVGPQQQVLRDRRGPAGVQRRPEAHPRVPEGRVQQPGLVQLRLREGAAVLGLLHQLGPGHDGLDPDAGPDRRDAVQVRIRHGHEPLADPLVEGTARRRRHGVGSGVVHEGLRRVCRRDQVRRQDAPRGEDGDPRRRAPGHRRVHQLQGRGREEGLGAHRRRLRRFVHGPGVFVGLLPELEQQRARDRRVHARRARRRRVGNQGRARRRR